MVKMTKTLYARIETTLDALIVIEACRLGILPMINRRLLAFERQNPAEPSMASPSSQGLRRRSRNLIEHGSVFVFHEEDSGINRWTDGRVWSPSRISGNFLVYKELLHKFPNEKCRTPTQKAHARAGSVIRDPKVQEMIEREGLVVQGSAKGTFVEKKDGLIKKTICIQGLDIPPPEKLRHWALASQTRDPRELNIRSTGVFHLVCYERPGDTTPLNLPSWYTQLNNLPLSRTIITQQKFRNPMVIRPAGDDSRAWPLNEYVPNSWIAEGRPASKRSSSSTQQVCPPAAVHNSHGHQCNPVSKTATRLLNGRSYPMGARDTSARVMDHSSSYGQRDDSWKVIRGCKSPGGKWHLVSAPPPSSQSIDHTTGALHSHHAIQQPQEKHGKGSQSHTRAHTDQHHHHAKRCRHDTLSGSPYSSSSLSPASSIASEFSLSDSTSRTQAAEMPLASHMGHDDQEGFWHTTLAAAHAEAVCADVRMGYLPEMNGYVGEMPEQAGQFLCPGSFFCPPATTPHECPAPPGGVGIVSPVTMLASSAPSASIRETRASASLGRNHHRPYLSMPRASPYRSAPTTVRSAPSTPMPFPGRNPLGDPASGFSSGPLTATPDMAAPWPSSGGVAPEGFGCLPYPPAMLSIGHHPAAELVLHHAPHFHNEMHGQHSLGGRAYITPCGTPSQHDHPSGIPGDGVYHHHPQLASLLIPNLPSPQPPSTLATVHVGPLTEEPWPVVAHNYHQHHHHNHHHPQYEHEHSGHLPGPFATETLAFEASLVTQQQQQQQFQPLQPPSAAADVGPSLSLSPMQVLVTLGCRPGAEDLHLPLLPDTAKGESPLPSSLSPSSSSTGQPLDRIVAALDPLHSPAQCSVGVDTPLKPLSTTTTTTCTSGAVSTPKALEDKSPVGGLEGVAACDGLWEDNKKSVTTTATTTTNTTTKAEEEVKDEEEREEHGLLLTTWPSPIKHLPFTP